MKYFTETPKSAELLHPRVKYLIDLCVEKMPEGLEDYEYDNMRSEAEFRFGILEGRADSFGNTLFVCYTNKGRLFILTVFGEDWEESELDMSVIPAGMEQLYITTYIQNIISEIDPFVDYDLCQYLCDSMDYSQLIYEDVDSEEDFH